MKRISGLLAWVVLGIAVLATGAAADVLTLAPAEVVVAPADESGVTRVALRFDLSGMRQGTGRRIEDALLEWHVSGVPSDRTTEYAAHAAVSSWSAQAVAAGEAEVSFAEEPSATWEFTPRDYEVIGSGLVRLDLKDLVAAWASGAATNYGVVLMTGDLGRAYAVSQAAEIRLTVRYGFVKS